MHINIQWNSDEKYTKWFHTIAQQLHSNVKTKPKSKVIKKKKWDSTLREISFGNVSRGKKRTECYTQSKQLLSTEKLHRTP